ncbi:MAG: DUF4911 domain-containing protein [Deltaproteobacteria bacterium]
MVIRTDMIRRWFKLKKGDITLVQFILEGYEGWVTVSTIDPHIAIIQVQIIPDFLEDANGILDHLRGRFMLQEIPPDMKQAPLC